ncbi:O-antigen ligase family protein [Conexibacter stalactiti]|uniref:O-antigen ligase family protein n=1 Tax=Conexibacter stalactiti TaxID=1940611 RepID=A0ABU4HMQ0_9ACTN|nr:O-antigen ligase family protein [Conexibacter stalactiti]MDW5594586.1 O-antigen ligase family protein [Conexibacter stalactiti]MEC5035228.1 O-antigen ligase family protein [Conexibacter stalactiti]
MLAVPFALAGPAPEAGAVVAVLLVACALVARSDRMRALAMSGALLLAPVLLVSDIWDSPQMEVVRDHSGAALAAAAVGLVALSLLATLMARQPLLLPVLTVAALPFRIPIEVGGSTSNLLVPLYLVVAAGALAFIVPALRADPEAPPPPRAWQPGWLERLLALFIVLYGVQATYSADFEKALQQIAFFYVPFALLFVLLAQIDWTPRLLRWCFGVLVGLALIFSGIGYVEYLTRHIFLNPKLIASNELHTYFRTNSVFFDPNIYGRFLVVAMLAVAATLLHTRRRELLIGGSIVLAALWAGLVLTLSQSSFVALLVGLATLAVLAWGVRRTLLPTLAVVLVAGAAVLITPSTFGIDLNNLDASTSGRSGLVTSGGSLFADRPLQGFGSGAFEAEYRDRNGREGGDAAATSHTIPVTVASEQGVIGLIAYLALLAAAFARLLRGAAGTPARAFVAAAFLALIVHTLIYAAFLEDPLTWALLGIGTALAAQVVREPRRRRAGAAASVAAAQELSDGSALPKPGAAGGRRLTTDSSLPAT